MQVAPQSVELGFEKVAQVTGGQRSTPPRPATVKPISPISPIKPVKSSASVRRIRRVGSKALKLTGTERGNLRYLSSLSSLPKLPKLPTYLSSLRATKLKLPAALLCIFCYRWCHPRIGSSPELERPSSANVKLYDGCSMLSFPLRCVKKLQDDQSCAVKFTYTSISATLSSTASIPPVQCCQQPQISQSHDSMPEGGPAGGPEAFIPRTTL